MAEKDKSLDFASESFDPLKALYSKNIRLPNPKAPIFDNIHKYRSSLVPRAKKPQKQVCYMGCLGYKADIYNMYFLSKEVITKISVSEEAYISCGNFYCY